MKKQMRICLLQHCAFCLLSVQKKTTLENRKIKDEHFGESLEPQKITRKELGFNCLLPIRRPRGS